MVAPQQNQDQSRPNVDQRLPGWQRMVLIVVCLISILIALYLTVLKLTGRISDLAGCGGPGGCADVLGGRWANWLRLPISLWALVAYLPLLFLAYKRLSTPRQVTLAFVAAATIFCAAIWFVFVQAFDWTSLVPQQLRSDASKSASIPARTSLAEQSRL